jgi:hypothetical protein
LTRKGNHWLNRASSQYQFGSGAANRAHLKTPDGLKGRDLSGERFAGSLLQQILFAVYKTAEEDDP